MCFCVLGVLGVLGAQPENSTQGFIGFRLCPQNPKNTRTSGSCAKRSRAEGAVGLQVREQPENDEGIGFRVFRVYIVERV